MTPPCIDTSVIIRLLSGDDATKQQRSEELFRRIEDGGMIAAAPITVIAEAVYVLTSKQLYNRPREQVAAMLSVLVRLPHFHVEDRQTVLAALDLYGRTGGLDFSDAYIAAYMRAGHSTELYSYDSDFDRIADITRLEP